MARQRKFTFLFLLVFLFKKNLFMFSTNKRCHLRIQISVLTVCFSVYTYYSEMLRVMCLEEHERDVCSIVINRHKTSSSGYRITLPIVSCTDRHTDTQTDRDKENSRTTSRRELDLSRKKHCKRNIFLSSS
jgi:hypothetical protein